MFLRSSRSDHIVLESSVLKHLILFCGIKGYTGAHIHLAAVPVGLNRPLGTRSSVRKREWNHYGAAAVSANWEEMLLDHRTQWEIFKLNSRAYVKNFRYRDTTAALAVWGTLLWEINDTLDQQCNAMGIRVGGPRTGAPDELA